MIYVVRNWNRFQHYRDRNPPWIKLHFELLSSRDWVMLADASRVLAVACMLVASRNDGQIDCSARGLQYLKRVAYLNEDPDPKPLIECGFLEPASNTLAHASNMQASARPETETETETEEDSRRGATAPPGSNGSTKDLIWNVGVDLLTAAGEKSSTARSFLGKLCKEHGDDAVREAVGRAVAVAPAEPKAWLRAAVRDTAAPDPFQGAI
jgi:hypothetical protein